MVWLPRWGCDGMIGSSKKLLMARAGVVPAGNVTVTYIGETVTGVDGTTFSFTGVNIGTAASDRIVVAVFHASGGTTGATITSLTCSAGTLDTAVSGVNAFQNAAITYIQIASGTTADFSVTYSGTKNRANLHVYTLTGWTTSTPLTTDSDAASATTASSTLDIPTGAAAIYAVTASGTPTGTWSSATETYDRNIGGETTSAIGAWREDAGNGHVETVTLSASVTLILVGASWK